MIDETLEAEFALRQRHPEREEIYDDHRRRSAARARGAATVPLDLRYGAGPRCLLDVFPAGDRRPGAVLYSWRLLAGAG